MSMMKAFLALGAPLGEVRAVNGFERCGGSTAAIAVASTAATAVAAASTAAAAAATAAAVDEAGRRGRRRLICGQLLLVRSQRSHGPCESRLVLPGAQRSSVASPRGSLRCAVCHPLAEHRVPEASLHRRPRLQGTDGTAACRVPFAVAGVRDARQRRSKPRDRCPPRPCRAEHVGQGQSVPGHFGEAVAQISRRAASHCCRLQRGRRATCAARRAGRGPASCRRTRVSARTEADSPTSGSTAPCERAFEP